MFKVLRNFRVYGGPKLVHKFERGMVISKTDLGDSSNGSKIKYFLEKGFIVSLDKKDKTIVKNKENFKESTLTIGEVVKSVPLDKDERIASEKVEKDLEESDFDNISYDEESLRSMKIDDLRSLATSFGLEIKSRSKSDFIEAIMEIDN